MDLQQHIETCVVDLAEMTYPKCPAMAPRWADLTDDDDEHGKDSDTDSAVLPPAAQEQDQSDGASSAPSVPPSGADSLASTCLSGWESDGSDWLPPSPARDQQPPPSLLTPPVTAAEAAPVWQSHSRGAASVTAAAAPQQPWPVLVPVFWAPTFVSYPSPPFTPFAPEWKIVPDHSGSVLLLHDAGKCKPCLFAHTKTGCSNGDACPFCHEKHRARGPRPAKVVRNRCKQMVAKFKDEGNTEALEILAKDNLYCGKLLTPVDECRMWSGR